MSNFDKAIETILEHEGGFVDNRHDPGGATNYGVSLRRLKQQGDLDEDGWLDGDFDHDGDVDADDIKVMTEEDAIEFYKANFWVPVYDQMTFVIAEKVFDMNVNMGKRQAHKLVQRALRAHGSELDDDGVLGPKSMAAIGMATSELIYSLRCTQAGFYRALILRNAALRKNGVRKQNGSEYEDFSVFRKGWLKRAYS